MITRQQYMNTNDLHQEYYLQFATTETFKFVEKEVGLELLLKSEDPCLNDIIRLTGGHWVWDDSPIDLLIARVAGEIGSGGLPSPSTKTCVGKAAAREMLRLIEVAGKELGVSNEKILEVYKEKGDKAVGLVPRTILNSIGDSDGLENGKTAERTLR